MESKENQIAPEMGNNTTASGPEEIPTEAVSPVEAVAETEDPKVEKLNKKEEKQRQKQEAKQQKLEIKAAKKAAKAEKKAEKKANKKNRHRLSSMLVNDAAAIIDKHDRIQAGIDRLFAGLLYSIVYEYNDIRTRYKGNARQIIIDFFSMIVVICAMLILFEHNTVFQYSYNGRVLGYVEDQNEVYNIIDVAGDQLSSKNEANIEFKVNDNLTFKKVSSTNRDTDTADQVLNKLTYMTDIEVTAYGIFEDNNLKAIVESESVADSLLEATLNYYRTPDKGMKVDEVVYKNSVEVRPLNVMLRSVMSRTEAREMLIEGGDFEIQHIVMEDETLQSISEAYNIDEEDIIREETEEEAEESEETEEMATMEETSSGLEPGELITMERNKVKPIVVQMTESGTMSEVIEYKTIEKKTDDLYIGDREVQTEGVNGRQTITGTLVKENNKEVSRDIESSEVLKEVVDEVVLVGTNEKPRWYPTGTYTLPVHNPVITSYYGARWGRTHEGLDYGAATGTSIYAADGGTVIRSSYYSGYGLCVEVEHLDGTFTRYAHCSASLVSVGDKVWQGQEIAKVGSTGNSTGPHLHFEIHPYGGGAVDPYPYLYGSNDGNGTN